MGAIRLALARRRYLRLGDTRLGPKGEVLRMVVAFAVLRWEDGRVRLTNYKCVSEGAGFACLLSIFISRRIRCDGVLTGGHAIEAVA